MKILPAVAVLAAASLACSTLLPPPTPTPTPIPLPTSTPVPTPTAPPTATAVPIPTKAPLTSEGRPLPIGDPLVSDTFDDNSNLWDEWSDSDGSVAVQDGELHIRVLLTEWFFWSQPAAELDDIDLIVDVRLVEGSEVNASYGVMCRYVDTDNFYIFTVTPDGFYNISAYIDDVYTEIVPWEESSAIAPGPAANKVRTVCAGPDLELYVNDTLLAAARDETFSRGSFALHAGTFDEGTDPVTIAFDNLAIYAP